ncbi:MAG: tetratricopeptide repeat protein [Spirochaetaceae bacterium]|nr:tetratricopeptide repeat protein [Spirochaetaceae bacterium]
MKKNIKTTLLFIIYGICVLFQSFSSDLYDTAVSVFQENRPAEAQVLLEKLIAEEGDDPAVYNYLGITYYQQGKVKEALDAFVKGAEIPFSNKSLLYFNAGNAAYSIKDYSSAEKYFSMSIEFDETYSASFLNRANTRINLGSLKDALDDYKKYLELEPDSQQKTVIENLMIAISEQLSVSSANDAKKQAE